MRTPRDLLGNIMEDEIVCTGFFRANAEETISCLDKFEMGGPLQYFLGNMSEAPVNLVYAFLHPAQWLDWSNIWYTRYYTLDRQTTFPCILR